MTRMRRWVLTLSLPWMLAAAGSAAAATDFKAALAEAEANVETAEGQKYDADFGKQFGQRYLDTMVRCTKDTAAADRTSFDVLVRVSDEGAPEEILVDPPSKVGACLREEVRKGKFSKPPKAPYWVQVEMKLKP